MRRCGHPLGHGQASGSVLVMLFSENSPGRLEVLSQQSPERRLHAVMEIAVACRQMRCPTCQSTDMMQQGITAPGKQRYRCTNLSCSSHTFLVEYSPQGRVPAVKQQMLEMTWNGSGIRDMARVRHISPSTVIEA